MKRILTYLLCFWFGISFSQNKQVDSLKSALKTQFKNEQDDSVKCMILRSMYEIEDNSEEKINLMKKRLEIGEAQCQKQISAIKRDFFKRQIAGAYNNSGIVFKDRGDIFKALDYYSKSLSVYEEISNKKGIATILSNIGVIYNDQKQAEKALEFYNKSLHIREEINDKMGIATSLNNIGVIYKDFGDPSVRNKKESVKLGNLKAFDFWSKSLAIKKELDDKKGMSDSYNNFGSLYETWGDLNKSLIFFQDALRLREEINDLPGVAESLNNIGHILYRLKSYSSALMHANRSLQMGEELGHPSLIRDGAKLLKEIYNATGKYQLALQNYEVYIVMRDSINNEETKKASLKNQLNYEYKKKSIADSVAYSKEKQIANAELEKQNAEIKSKHIQQYFMIGGMLLFCVFAFFMYSRYRITQKQKKVIETQKLMVEVKQKEIIDSIRYGEKIQQAKMPTEHYILKELKRLKG